MQDTEKSIKDYLKDFNNDSSFRKLKEKYCTPSFFEISGVSRSEIIHSSFLAWLLKGAEVISGKEYTPLMGLLDILVERDGQRNQKTQIDNNVKNAIISRTITIDNIRVRCEQSIGKLGVAKNSKDRIDIYIVCDVHGLKGVDQFEIIIENKIKSKEGNEKLKDFTSKKELTNFQKYYNSLTQTQRYVCGTDYQNKTIVNDLNTKANASEIGKPERTEWISNTNSIKQFYVFLSPIASYLLKDYSKIEMDDTCESERFIHINYQDIVDHIIDPILSSGSQTPKVQVLLEQYLNTLSMPYFNEDSDEESAESIIMATKNEDKELIQEFWEKYYSPIIQKSIIVHECIDIDAISRQSLFNDVISGVLQDSSNDINYDDTFGTLIISEKNKKTHIELDKNVHICNVSTKTQNTKLYPGKYVAVTFLDLIKSKECYSELLLLYNFYEKNRSMILAALKILSDNDSSDYDGVRELYDKLTNNAKPKYIIIHNKVVLNEESNNMFIGKNLHETVITFIENELNSVSDNIADKKSAIRIFFNQIRNGYALETVEDKTDKKRYDIFVKNDNKYTYSSRLDRCDQIPEDNFIASNQWGSLDDEKGTFDLFLKKVEEQFDQYKIFTIEDYLANQEEIGQAAE